MEYRESLEYLDRLGNEVLGMKFGLETVRTMLRELGNPQEKVPSVLVAGTNGKGSVASYLSNILIAGGFKTGLYLSPHVVAVEERIQANGRQIGPSEFAECLSGVARVAESLRGEGRPTYFEVLTATAFLYFARSALDVAVMEVGMGGRLDSTNVVVPLLSVITPISFDHQKQLGSTISQIAAEKAGIIHPGRPVLISPQEPEARTVIESRAQAAGAPLHQLDQDEIVAVGSPGGSYTVEYHGVRSPLRLMGRHQVTNAALAIRAAELLEPPLVIDAKAMAEGIGRTEAPGRIQRISQDPFLFVDGGHNRQAARNLVEFVLAHTPLPRALVFSMMQDKDIREVAEILKAAFDRTFVVEMQSPRAASTERLLEAFPGAVAVQDPVKAIETAKKLCATTVVFGSFYLVGDVLRQLTPTCL
ncbi:MAG TPA: folylpolyglutamate synthase/dihydrofolate synthase family protein [Acidobacteriota bacterium]|nr:folylpolyglutamate synthase/dihydrofolate synthase family protein [Acidobacteriota bacterium]